MIEMIDFFQARRSADSRGYSTRMEVDPGNPSTRRAPVRRSPVAGRISALAPQTGSPSAQLFFGGAAAAIGEPV
jgi:hypothetical protein